MPISSTLAAAALAQGGPFTAAQAVAAGYDQREITRFAKAGIWTRVRHGVYVETAILPGDETRRHLLLLRASLLKLKSLAAASHVTAGVLHDIALLEPDLEVVHLTHERDRYARTRAGVRHHTASLPSGHLTKVDDVATTTAARTVIDIARHSSYDEGLVAIESALNKGVATFAELREVMDHCLDWPGALQAQRALAFASPYSESPGETLGRIAFDALGVPPPDQQAWIYDENGLIARTDYFWKDRHTVGEFDGMLKYTGTDPEENPLVKEKEREDRLRDAGLEVFRIYWRESRAKSPSVSRKAFAAFDRAARSTVKRTYRYKLQPTWR